ncbi:MAG TPA: hypothetical protein VFE33_28575 [Thermoanaerobaculia bacterium]|nr:hypothetical protein [Thermoanaerobaculia bacterium]
MEMGKYCKAYLLKDLRAYPQWTEKGENARKEKKEVDGKEIEVDTVLDDDSILYIQETYIVTHGIFLDENIIFDAVTDEWKDFCHNTLHFEIPVYEPINIPKAEGTTEGQSAEDTGAAG